LLYQEVFQNKLTSPDLLGVSSGASVGAAIALVLGLSSILVYCG
ncbi:MAG: iron ABC transporter permease, partial [Methanomicrobia archaeon]|nr:iron ABC transporter permease [Methanomicrobia archaeon]